MGLYLNPGNEAFRISVKDDIYVDKSGLIAFANAKLGKGKRFLCVSRPRRFGKSMAATMLSAYYDKSCDSSELFRGLEIESHPSYQQHLNQYDVIFIHVQKFLRKAGGAVHLASYIEERILSELKRVYDNILAPKEDSLPDALELVYAADKSPNKGFIFIIDEWDCIFREEKENTEAQKNYLDFLRDLFKDRIYVKLAYMTGILPIKKYGTHSALNIFDEYSMICPDALAKYAGFTEEEVERLCQKFGRDYEEVRRWYDGYWMGEFHIYNPKSVIDGMQSNHLRSFWTNTETYEALQVYIDINMDGLKEAMIAMLGGEQCEIDAGTFQNDMMTFNGKDDVLTLLVHLGYLGYNEKKRAVFIPNEEIREEFLRAIKTGKRQELIKAIECSDRLLEATLYMDETEVARCIEEVHNTVIAPDFYNNEQSLRSVIQLAYISRIDDYITFQELAGGNGYADMIFLPRRNSDKPAIIIELKWDKSVKGAIAQIKEKKYFRSIEHYGGDILLVGITYHKKSKKHECRIEKYTK